MNTLLKKLAPNSRSVVQYRRKQFLFIAFLNVTHSPKCDFSPRNDLCAFYINFSSSPAAGIAVEWNIITSLNEESSS